MKVLRYMICVALIFQGNLLKAQDVKNIIAKGNEAYKEQQYDKAIEMYREALKSSPGNPVASFNLGNALFRSKKYDEAVKVFDEASHHDSPGISPEKLFYNKGVSYTALKKLQESIDAYKQALRINSSDTLARENLQRALNELKRQQEQNDQQKQQQKQQKEDKPKPNPSKLNQQQVQQLLKALEEQEKKLQEKMMRKSPTTGQPDKDW